MIDFTKLQSSPRLLVEADLRPVQGDRFQPTGFADIGAAEYSRPDGEAGKERGVSMLLVESAQSVANRLEKTCLDDNGVDIQDELQGLPYIRASLDSNNQMKTLKTSSLVEAHRLASPYFIKSGWEEKLAAEMEYTQKGPIEWKQIYKTLFKYDPNSLIHGVFLSLLYDGRVRVPRAITGFIEASNVKQVISGGVKNSQIDPKGEIQVDAGKEVEKGIYSNVPYPRVEYVGDIKAYFNLDLSLIRGYGLPEAATKLLIGLALLKVRRFLGSHLRLRTACDLELAGDVRVTRPEGFGLAGENDLLNEVKGLIADCKGSFAEPAVTDLNVKVKIQKGKE